MNKFQNLSNVLDLTFKIILAILIGLFFYTYYRSEIFYGGLYKEYYLKYYFILIFSILILVFISFLNKKNKIKIYLVLISTICAFYISELFLIDFKNLFSKTKYEYYNDLKNKRDVVVAIHPFQFILKDPNRKNIFPLSGISKKLTIFCKKKENRKFIIYKSDRFGFRNEDMNWDAENSDFVLLGDSFVHGACVDSENTINSQMSKISASKFNRKINTINLGYSGSGPLLEYATLKEYIKKTKTKKVLYFFYEGNDLDNLYFEIKDPLLKKYLNYSFEQKLVNQQSKIDLVDNNLLKEEAKKQDLILYDFIKLRKLRSLLAKIFDKKSNIENFKKSEKSYQIYGEILVNLKKLTESQNAEFYFIYLPYISRFSDSNYDPNYEIYSKIMTMVKELDIRYIDLLQQVKLQNEDPLSLFQLRKYQHFNEAGYKFAAETIIEEINKIENKN